MKNPKRQMSHPHKRHSSTKFCRRDRKRKTYAFPNNVESSEIFEEKKSLKIKTEDPPTGKADSQMQSSDYMTKDANQKVNSPDLDLENSWSKFRNRMRSKGFAF